MRFIRNLAGALPLTGFICLYPRQRDAAFIDGLWRVLQHPQTLENLALVGKSYGDGAIKVEPRALERLRLPPEALAQAGLASARGARQLRLMEAETEYITTTDDLSL